MYSFNVFPFFFIFYVFYILLLYRTFNLSHIYCIHKSSKLKSENIYDVKVREEGRGCWSSRGVKAKIKHGIRSERKKLEKRLMNAAKVVKMRTLSW